MDHIPRHKQHSNGTDRRSPCPELLVHHFKRNLNLMSSGSNVDKRGKMIIVHSANPIYRWYTVGLSDDNRFPSSVHLQPISLELVESKVGEQNLILVNSHKNKEKNEVQGNVSRSPWVSLAENVQQHLLSSFKILRNEMECQQLVQLKPTLIARFGKVIFRGSPLLNLETVRKCPVAERNLRRFKRSFYTNVPTSYMENIIDEVCPKIGIEFKEEKDRYNVLLSDSTRPDETITCKCILNEDKRLNVYKVKMKPVRHLTMDISCLDKNLDLRLMLCTKRFLIALTDDEMHSIRDLINSSVLDSDVKGGLRWPLGRASFAGRYSVVGVWHTIDTGYKSPSLSLRVRHADRFNYRTAIGESTTEINLKLKAIVSELQEQVEINSISDMLKDTLKLIWDHFLCCEHFLT